MQAPQDIQSLWITHFPVSSFLVDSSKKLNLHGLISLMQESAWAHASNLGHGYKRTRDEGGSWVIARQRIEMNDWPKWEESLTIRTWLRPPGAVIVTRDFEFLCGERLVGQASAHWLTINHDNRKPTRLPFPDNPNLFRQDHHLDLEPLKLPTMTGLDELAKFTVRHTDLDMNGHVNNTRFAQWVLDSLPLSYHDRQQIKRYQINFLDEARPMERIRILGSHHAPGQPLRFQGESEPDGRLLFTAELLMR